MSDVAESFIGIQVGEVEPDPGEDEIDHFGGAVGELPAGWVGAVVFGVGLDDLCGVELWVDGDAQELEICFGCFVLDLSHRGGHSWADERATGVEEIDDGVFSFED